MAVMFSIQLNFKLATKPLIQVFLNLSEDRTCYSHKLYKFQAQNFKSCTFLRILKYEDF